MNTASASSPSIITMQSTTGSSLGGTGATGTYYTMAANSGSYLYAGTGTVTGAGVGTTTWGPQTITLQTSKNKMDVDELIETVQMLKERLLIITPIFEKHEKYPALKQAYDHYKMIEKMIAAD